MPSTKALVSGVVVTVVALWVWDMLKKNNVV